MTIDDTKRRNKTYSYFRQREQLIDDAEIQYTYNNIEAPGDENASYYVLSSTGSLPNTTVFSDLFSTSSGIKFGAATLPNYEISINDSIVATVSGATFQGPVVINGTNTLSVGSGSFQLSSNEVSWGSNNKIYLDGSDLVFKDDNNTSGWTLAELIKATGATNLTGTVNYVTASFTAPVAAASGSGQVITELTCKITSSGNPVLITGNVNMSANGGGAGFTYSVLQIFRNGVSITSPGIGYFVATQGGAYCVPISVMDFATAGVNQYTFVMGGNLPITLNKNRTVSWMSLLEVNNGYLGTDFVSASHNFVTHQEDLQLVSSSYISSTSDVIFSNYKDLLLDSSINQLTSSLSGSANDLYIINDGKVYEKPSSNFYIVNDFTSSTTTNTTPYLAYSYATDDLATYNINVMVNVKSTATTGSAVWTKYSHFYTTSSIVQTVSGTISDLDISNNPSLGMQLTSSAGNILIYVTGTTEPHVWGISSRIQTVKR